MHAEKTSRGGSVASLHSGSQGSSVAAAAALSTGNAARRSAYAAAVLLSSAGGLILEIVAGRMIAPYVGMSLYTWTAVIAVVLAGFSIGHWIGGRLANRGHAASCRILAWLLALAAVTTVACLPLIRLVSPFVLGADFHPITAIVLLTSALFILPSLFVGTLSPILTKLAIEEQPDAPGRALGLMFASGAIGSIAGTLAAGYLMISWIGSIGSVLAVAGGYFLMAGGFAWAARPSPRRAFASALAVLATGALLLGLSNRLEALTSPCKVESQYYCIQVMDFSPQTGRPSAIMVLDHLAHGINDQADPTYLHSPYLELTDSFLRDRFGDTEDFSAFFVGGGANTLPRAWDARHPGASLLIAEIDPAVTQMAEDAMWFTPSERTRVEHGDGRLVLRDLPQDLVFDAIVGDAYHDISVPQHLTTQEFADLIYERLAPEGFYAANVIDSSKRPLFLLALTRTLQSVFPEVQVWIHPEQVMEGARATYVVTAAREGFALDRLRGPNGETLSWILWPPEELASSIERSGVPLLTDNYAPVDRLMLHVLADEP